MVNETICDVLYGCYCILFAYIKAYRFVFTGCFGFVFFGKGGQHAAGMPLWAWKLWVDMRTHEAKAICVGNIKGGVGKSTNAVYLSDFLQHRFKRRNVITLDTDPQGTAFELLEPGSEVGSVQHLPVGDHYDGVNMTVLDSVLRHNR